MEHVVRIKVTDCRSCPFMHHHLGQGECWAECNHPDTGRGAYETILWGCREQFKEIPLWCPLLVAEGETVINNLRGGHYR